MKLLTRTAVRDRRYNKFVRPKPLPDRAFHFELDQPFELDAVFHGELADEIVDEPVYAEAHRLSFAQTALLHGENVHRANLADSVVVLYGVVRAADGCGQISVLARCRLG